MTAMICNAILSGSGGECSKNNALTFIGLKIEE
jgi:hypothetical protein